MERLTLNQQCNEIVVNNGSSDGAIDLFSYGPETQESARSLGSLYVVGHRGSDSSNMGYIVSLIAALAHREYYAQPGLDGREAFTRMLKKMNEIVDEFFTSADVDLSVGVFAIAGSSIMVSKLDKFRILLGREGQTIDILNNVMLFQKEHLDRRRFSSIISGSVQPGDRILAYYPSKQVAPRERSIKTHLTKLSAPELATKLEDIGKQYPTFATALFCIDMIQSSEPATAPSIQPEELARPAAPQAPTPAPSMDPPAAQLAWTPRQGAPITSATAIASSVPRGRTPEPVRELEPEQEVPNIIATEFALGTRRTAFSKIMGHIRFVRLDTRGKAIFLGCAAVLVFVGVLTAKSILFVDAQQQHAGQVMQTAQDNLKRVQDTQGDPIGGRQVIMRALSELAALDMATDKNVRNLTASLVGAMDKLDNAQPGSLSVVAQPDPKTDTIVMSVWSSSSASLWAVSRDADHSQSVVRLADGTVADRIAVEAFEPTALVPFKSGLIIIDASAKKLIRIMDGTTKIFDVPTQDALVAGTVYNGSLFMLTEHAILKVTDLDTDKPVTKQWLTDVADLATGAAQIYVDGSVWTMSRDGMLTEYYKGKKKAQTQTAIVPSGPWRLLDGPQEGQLGIGNSDTKRIYVLNMADGALVRTIKIDTQQPILQVFSGPDGSALFTTKDNKIWRAQ